MMDIIVPNRGKRRGTRDRHERDGERRNGEDSRADLDLFFAEVADATPLRDRDRIPAPRPEPRQAPLAGAEQPAQTLDVQRDGEHVWARARGVSAAQLAEIKGGALAPEAEIDLHGAVAEAAASRAEEFIRDSMAAGRRCVLVISGRGRNTGGVSVVKEAVVDRLAAGRCSRHIRVLSTAAPRHGGTGALYVVLKRAPKKRA